MNLLLPRLSRWISRNFTLRGMIIPMFLENRHLSGASAFRGAGYSLKTEDFRGLSPRTSSKTDVFRGLTSSKTQCPRRPIVFEDNAPRRTFWTSILPEFISDTSERYLNSLARSYQRFLSLLATPLESSLKLHFPTTNVSIDVPQPIPDSPLPSMIRTSDRPKAALIGSVAALAR